MAELSDYDKGYLAGLARAVNIIELYKTEAPWPPTGDALKHIDAIVAGLNLGVTMATVELESRK